MKIIIVMLMVLSSVNIAAQDVLKVGDTLGALPLTDQHDKTLVLTPVVKQIIFAADKSTSTWVGDFLDAKAAAWLAENSSVYVADIHKMPKLISRMIALPKLREKSYSVYLGRTATALSKLPHKEACVTLVGVDALVVTAIEYICSPQELVVALN
jgi:hypothetical protein